jgi:hypothetical protein
MWSLLFICGQLMSHPSATKNVRAILHHRFPDIRRRLKNDSCKRLASEQDSSHMKNSGCDARYLYIERRDQ